MNEKFLLRTILVLLALLAIFYYKNVIKPKYVDLPTAPTNQQSTTDTSKSNSKAADQTNSSVKNNNSSDPQPLTEESALDSSHERCLDISDMGYKGQGCLEENLPAKKKCFCRHFKKISNQCKAMVSEAKSACVAVKEVTDFANCLALNLGRVISKKVDIIGTMCK